nr:glutamic acid-rich protein-like [Tanacetum cinerariifolium]
MTSLFTESHNMVAILKKSDAAGGFGQIIDFLSGSYIQHALIVNPHVYISCVKQFWNTVVVKRSARMGYEKPSTKLTFYKAYFSSQWKFFIHTLLHTLSSKRTSWNELSSAMASALICLSTCQRFNFSKYIFESLVCNVDSTSKFYMYPRVGKGFSRVETPLFENMLEVRAVDVKEEVQVLAQDNVVQENVTEEIAYKVVTPTPTSPSPPSPQVLDKYSTLVLRVEGLETANTAQQLEILKLKASVKKLERLNKVKSSKLRRLKKVGTSQRVESSEDVENVFNQGRISVDMETDEGNELEVDQENTPIPAAKPAVAAASTPIPAAEPKVLKIATAPAGVVIRDPEEELHTKTLAETPTVKDKGKRILIKDPKPMKKNDQVEIDAEYARKLQEELNKEHEESFKNIDWNAAFDHVQAKETQYIKRYHGFKKKTQSKSKARKNMISYLRNIKGYKMEFFKGLTFDDILPIFQARFDANLKFLFKSREEMKKEDEEIIKSINETPAHKATKRRRLRKQAKED